MENSNLIIATSFGMKLKPEDKERTSIEFKLDFSSLSREQLAVYASREVTRDINSEVRDGKKLIGEVKDQTIEVKPFEKGERGKAKVTEDLALAKLAEVHGVSIEVLKTLLTKVKGGVK